ncbi:MAG: presqualene diphosphate synthase HpnD [Nitrospirae bacterium]|nr:presqualene diphosphate synthase HpnD [Nitrospirota bacterium]MDA1303506.1 presqualene diphosphate synthase HpnD [Nitrospirota bacterium]
MTQMTPEEAHAYCTAKTKASGSNFFYSFFFLPRFRREAMYTVYTFCHEVDDTVDEPPPGTDPQEQLSKWRQEIKAVYQGTPQYPVTISLAEHVQRLSIPEEYLQELVTGMEMDLTHTRYATFDDLYPYCYRVASIVGLICLKVFSTQDPRAQEYAINLGVAFQLTNILRDVGADAERQRIYLPQEDLARFKYTEPQLLAKTYSPQFLELMKFEAARAHEFYDKAQAVYSTLSPKDRRSLLAAEIMRGVYYRILTRIETSNYAVYQSRIRIHPAKRILIAIGCWLRTSFKNRWSAKS